MNKPIRVMMLGFRGFPGVQGGVETHAGHLCPLLAKLGCEVTALVRSSYQLAETGPEWKGVKFISLWAPRIGGLEAFLHSFLGTLYAAIKRPDILHIHAVGPAIMALPARLLGLRVVVTHHGADYNRQKWSGFARFILRSGERIGMCLSNARIVISNEIARNVRSKYGMDSILIPNGVVRQQIPASKTALDVFGLVPHRYVLMVSRLVPEKRHHDLINAFAIAGLKGWKLALVGASDHPDAYTESVVEAAASQPDIVYAGFQSGLALRELYTHAGIFVLPSSHEGLPIALLEALSFGLPAIASDIPANLEVGLSAEHYFNLGDAAHLADRMIYHAGKDYDPAARESVRNWVTEKYDWRDIAARTLNVYRQVTAQKSN